MNIENADMSYKRAFASTTLSMFEFILESEEKDLFEYIDMTRKVYDDEEIERIFPHVSKWLKEREPNFFKK